MEMAGGQPGWLLPRPCAGCSGQVGSVVMHTCTTAYIQCIVVLDMVNTSLPTCTQTYELSTCHKMPYGGRGCVCTKMKQSSCRLPHASHWQVPRSLAMQLGPAGQKNMFGMRPHPQSACENGPSNCNRAGAPCPRNKMWLQTQACMCFKLWGGGQLAFAMWCAMCVCVCAVCCSCDLQAPCCPSNTHCYSHMFGMLVSLHRTHEIQLGTRCFLYVGV